MATDRIYTELDCIMDTRMAIVSQIDEEAAVSLVTSEKYHARLHDTFSLYHEGFDDEAFKKRYAERTVEDIKGNTYPTAVVKRLYGFAETCRRLRDTAPEPQTISLVVNLYPYKFSDEEKEVLRDVISASTLIEEIAFWEMPVGDLTPTTIRANFTQVILYDANEWITMHHEALVLAPMPQVMLFSPIIAAEPGKGEEAILSGVAPNVLHDLYVGHIELCLVKLEEFSFTA